MSPDWFAGVAFGIVFSCLGGLGWVLVRFDDTPRESPS